MGRTFQRAYGWLAGGVLALLLTVGAQAGTTGKIAGRVTDASTGEPLPGATVLIEGTGQGAAADIDGYYSIINVRPGTYTLIVRYVGYSDTRVEEVEVIVDKTTTIDVALQEEIVEGQEVVVTAERPLVEVDRTTTTAFVSADQLESLPVNSLGDVINLQAGVVDGHFRGGRYGEVAYLVNGVPIMNPYSNSQAFEVEKNMVSGLEIISGVFNAEYGQAMSGVVNIVTKDVPTEWTGSFSGEVGSVASGRQLEYVERADGERVAFATGDSITVGPGTGLPITAFRSVSVPYHEAAGLFSRQDVQVSLGGPIIKDRLGIQLTGRRVYDEGHVIGRNVFAPWDSVITSIPGNDDIKDGDYRTWLYASTGDQSFMPGHSERYSLNGTLTYRFSPSVRADYNLFFQDNRGRNAQRTWKYVPEGVNRWFNQSQFHLLGLHFTFGSSAFANLNYSYLRDDGGSRLYDIPENFEETGALDDRYVSDESSQGGENNTFLMGGNELFNGSDLTETHTVLADFTHQVNRTHQMKTGFSARMHSLHNGSYGIEVGNTTGWLAVPSINRYGRDTLRTQPYELAAYVQDKMEFKNLIVNAGVRFDYFEPDFLVPVNWDQAEFEYIPDDAGNMVYNRRKASARSQVSPRLGIAFPISSTGVIRFSAGMFFQIPQLSFLYQNPEFEVDKEATSVNFGNPDIDPERTLHFEVGLQQGLTDDLGLEVTVFSKDIRNLTGVTYGYYVANTGDFIRYMNRDVGTSQGITLSLFQRPTGPLSWDVDYTLQFAEGTSSDPRQSYDRWKAGMGDIITLNRLNWDRRHVLTNSITYEPVRALSLNLINRFMTGTPYTPVRDKIESFTPNNLDRPPAFVSDARLYYRPPVFEGLNLVLQVENIFDARHHWDIHNDTGRADESVLLQEYRRTNVPAQGVNSLDDFFFTQDRFSPPRRVIIGVRYEF